MKLISLFLALAFAVPSWSQTAKRHPRVMEIEKLLQSEIQTAVRDLLPGQSFHAKVILDPLHRQTSSVNGKEDLPFYESSDEIKDEWDSPEKSDFELLTRVNRISIKAFVPSTLTPEQIAEVKTVIINRIPYVEGRDLVEVEVRNWPVPTDHSRYTSWILGVGLVLLLIMGVLYFGVMSVAISRITKAIKAIKISGGDSSVSGALTPIALSSASAPNSPSGGALSSGQVQINDTIRMTEVILDVIKNFETSQAFPTLDDMVLFEQYFQSNPASVGGLLAEFPTPIRNKVFSYSYSNSWLKGMTDSGDIDAISFELMNKLVRIPRDGRSSEWNELLILCWRLGPQLSVFLKKLNTADSLIILKSLPQSIAIQTARELMPGEWAAILKTNGTFQILSSEKCSQYSKMAIDFKPLRPINALEQFKRDSDLIKYLKITDPGFEKEIYGATPADSALKSLRPPFFPILEADPQLLQEFTPLVPIEDWSLSLLNISKDVRSKVETTLSDKQKFRLVELYKRFDRSPVGPETIGDARERIGRLFQEFQNTKDVASHESPLQEAA